LEADEIKEILRLFSQKNDFKPRTRGESALAAVTCYWKIGSDTDHWTRRGESSTGVPLRQGVVAVDPAIIPYGSMVLIEGVPGAFVAADCGSHVRQKVAVMKTARTAKEKEAIVIDVYFVQEKEGRAFDASLPKFVKIHYFTPSSRNT
jgi:3D (Asp-Asp-Asp) domain-containing protein